MAKRSSSKPASTVGFGVDVGGSGIKAALVDLTKGELLSDRMRVDTPEESTPDNIADIIAGLLEQVDYDGPVGVAIPSVIQRGIARTAANIDKSWIGTDVVALMEQRLGRNCTVLNDADAAGLAENAFGAAKDQDGVVLLLTFGTGIGSALLTDGVLLPNTEFGHIETRGFEGEKLAAGSVKDDLALTYDEWTQRVNVYLEVLEQGLWPDLIIVGGGISKRADKWLPMLTNRTPVVPAHLLNNAGIVGAALAARHASTG